MTDRKPILGLCITLLAAVIVLLAAIPAGASYEFQDKLDSSPDAAGDRKAAPGEVLVRFRSGIGQQTRAAALGQVDATVKERLPVRGLRLVAIDRTTSARKAAAELEEQRGVRYAEPNYIYRIQATPNDPRLDQLWGLHNTGQDVDGTSGIPDADIDAPEAWDTATGSSDVTVAVVDTGVAYGHPDLAPNIRTNPGETGGGKESNGIDDDANGLIDDWRGWDFYRSDNDPDDLNGHGSHVAGTIGARGDDGYGAVGVNWQVGLMPLRVCSARGSCFASDIASAFAYAGAEGVEVVNVSLGGSFSYAISDSIAGAPETLFAVAAGNVSYDMDSQYTTKQYPCGYKFQNIVCVAATTQDDELAGFSSYGPSSVDLGAPGTNVLSTWPAYETVYSEGFEDDISSTWATGGRHDTWARTDEAAASGAFSLTDSPGAEYLPDTYSFANTTDPIDLSDEVGCLLEYQLRLDMQFGDLNVLGSNDGSYWRSIARWTGSTSGDFVGLGSEISGFDERSEFYLQFLLRDRTGTTGGGGAHVDDVEVRCRTSTFAGDEFELLQGTSMATPHVAGAAALLSSIRPGASPSALRGALIANSDPLPALDGKTVSGGRLNLDVDRLDAPLITETDPESPADENRPRVSGWIGPGDPMQVEVFRNADCSGAPAASGSDEQFLGEGIPIDVPDDATTTLTARDAAGGGGPCSEPFDYIEDSSFPPAFIYWTNGSAIGRANLDGSGAQQGFVSGAVGSCGVALGERSIYWQGVWLYPFNDRESGSGFFRIIDVARTELDGSNSQRIFGAYTVGGSTDEYSEIEPADLACGVAVDGQFAYWADQPSSPGTIGRVRVDGSGRESNFISGAERPCGVAVDGDYIYWANSDGNTIGRANRDGSSPDQNFISGASSPCGVAVDRSYIYWANSGGDTIGRANRDGSSPDQNFISGASSPCGVAVDRSYIYWANSGGDTIGRASLDGSGAEQAFIGDVGHPCGVSVDSSLTPPWPQTEITEGPTGLTNDSSPSFRFTSNKPGSTFECRLGSEAFRACASPKAYRDVPDGPHRFAVRATSSDGYRDETAGIRGFEVDTVLDGSAAAKRRQTQKGKRVVLKAEVRAGEELDAEARGKIRLNMRRYKLKPQSETVGASKKKGLKLEPKKRKHARKIVRALRKSKKAKVKLKVKLTDDAGNKKVEKLKVRLRR